MCSDKLQGMRSLLQFNAINSKFDTKWLFSSRQAQPRSKQSIAAKDAIYGRAL
jgi:hypothetical protein